MCDPSAFLLRLTSQTMLARLKANRASSLAKTVYNRDFFAVRDRTDGHEDVFNFKTARAQAIDYEAERRKGLQEHVVLAFGEIRRVYRMVCGFRGRGKAQRSSYCPRLMRPTTSDWHARRMQRAMVLTFSECN